MGNFLHENNQFPLLYTLFPKNIRNKKRLFHLLILNKKMKKVIFSVAFIALFSVSAFAQGNPSGKKGGKISTEQVPGEDRQAQNYMNDGRSGRTIAIESKDCAAEHLGTILFHNQTKKLITLEVTDIKNEKVCEVTIESGKSMYVRDIEMGEYLYKMSSSKKAKKKNMVNVIECTLKSIVIDAKTFK